MQTAVYLIDVVRDMMCATKLVRVNIGIVSRPLSKLGTERAEDTTIHAAGVRIEYLDIHARAAEDLHDRQNELHIVRTA